MWGGGIFFFFCLKAPTRRRRRLGRGMVEKKGAGIFFYQATNKKKSRNLFKFVLVPLSASVERVDVSRMRDFFCTMWRFYSVESLLSPGPTPSSLDVVAVAGAAAVLRDPEVLPAGQPDQQPGIHGPQNYQWQSRAAENLIP